MGVDEGEIEWDEGIYDENGMISDEICSAERKATSNCCNEPLSSEDMGIVLVPARG